MIIGKLILLQFVVVFVLLIIIYFICYNLSLVHTIIFRFFLNNMIYLSFLLNMKQIRYTDESRYLKEYKVFNEYYIYLKPGTQIFLYQKV